MQTRTSGSIIIISAPSGAGKTTLCRRLIASSDRIKVSVSFTTRPPRPGEQNHVDYTFISAPEFRRMIDAGEFVEWAEVHSNFYGTSRRRLEELADAGFDSILDIDTQGARQIRDIFPGSVSIFIMPPSLEVLRSRLVGRNSDAPEVIARRMAKAVEEMREYVRYDYVIVNDILEQALDDLCSIVKAERRRTVRLNPDWIREFIAE